jgi:hypothetical protein
MNRSLTVLALLIFAHAAVAQSKVHSAIGDDVRTITLGSVTLTIGMAHDAVLAKLTENYQVNKTANSDSSWMVLSKDGPPYTAVASVGFKDGKLVSVVKYWGPEDQQKGMDFASALYAAMHSVSQSRSEACTVSTSANEEPQTEMKTVFLTCTERYFRIDIMRSEKFGNAAYISEVVQAPEK